MFQFSFPVVLVFKGKKCTLKQLRYMSKSLLGLSDALWIVLREQLELR